MNLWVTAFGINNKNISGGHYTSRRFLQKATSKNKINYIEILYKDFEIDESEIEQYALKRCVTYRVNKFNLGLCWIFMFWVPRVFITRINIKFIFYIIRNRHMLNNVHCEFSQTLIYGWLFRALNKKIRLSARLHDIQYQRLTRSYPVLQMDFLSFIIKKIEYIILLPYDSIYVPSSKDKIILAQMGVLQEKIIIDDICQMFKKGVTRKFLNKNKTNIAFHGNFRRKDNIEALNYLLNHICPNLMDGVDVHIFGYGLENIPGFPKNTLFHGYVENIESFIIDKDISIGIAPLLFGAGVKIKIYDYLSAGCHVIATDIAAEGIENNKLLITERSKFANSINKMHLERQFLHEP